MSAPPTSPDPALALVFTRTVAVPPAHLWRGWTDAALLPRWFCPRPWQVTHCEIDLRPGGIFRTVMQGPDGTVHDEGAGCWLVVEPTRRLVWTSALGPGFAPPAHKPDALPMTVELLFTPTEDGGCHYRATVHHADPASRDRHAAMGFEQGWGVALEQLVELWQPR